MTKRFLIAELLYGIAFTIFCVYWYFYGYNFSRQKGDVEFDCIEIILVLQYAFLLVFSLSVTRLKLWHILVLPPAIIIVAITLTIGVIFLLPPNVNSTDRNLLLVYEAVNFIVFSGGLFLLQRIKSAGRTK